MFTQTGRKTIGMWTFVKLQQVDVFKNNAHTKETMLSSANRIGVFKKIDQLD